MIRIKHTVLFFIVVNILCWGTYLYVNNQSGAFTAQPSMIDSTLVYDSVTVTKNVKHYLPQEEIVPFTNDEKSLPMAAAPMKKDSVKKYIYVPKKEKIGIPRMQVETLYVAVKEPDVSGFDELFSKYWPILVTIFTSLPAIVIKWKEMIDKLKNKNKETTNDTD